MKCGTTALKCVLRRHPGIYIPASEVHFFNYDDILQHPDFYIYWRGRWSGPEGLSSEAMEDWHAEFFADALPTQLLGEDSPTVIASPHLFPRIRERSPGLKWIVMLRDPVDRTYSNYWHLLLSGRLSGSFEDALQYDSYNLIYRSCYFEQLASLLSVFPSDQVHVVLFEDWVANPRRVLEQVLKFLGVTECSAELVSTGTHYHRRQYPASVIGWRLRNKFIKGRHRRIYRSYLPCHQGLGGLSNSIAGRALQYIHDQINRPCRKNCPEMNDATRVMLKAMFLRRLRGIDEMVGRDVMRSWGLVET